MHLRRSCTGSLAPHRPLAVVLVGFFCCLLTEAYPVAESPRIVRHSVTRSGDRMVISCKADPGHPDDFTLIYWLVNRTFIELVYPDGRIHEGEERAVEENGRALVQRDLIFDMVRKEDYRANFTCVVNSPAGIDKITLRLGSFSGN
ncbi:hypothetical protein COCON_G00072810, partial [Conger conger]